MSLLRTWISPYCPKKPVVFLGLSYCTFSFRKNLLFRRYYGYRLVGFGISDRENNWRLYIMVLYLLGNLFAVDQHIYRIGWLHLAQQPGDGCNELNDLPFPLQSDQPANRMWVTGALWGLSGDLPTWDSERHYIWPQIPSLYPLPVIFVPILFHLK